MAKPDSHPLWQHHAKRYFFIALGCLFFSIGFIGVFVPLLPTTVFMLLALWAFARSSERLHNYLWQHPRFGPAIRNWHQHGIIPRRAKVGAVTVMMLSSVFLIFFSAVPGWAVFLAVLLMVVVAIWLVSRPERSVSPGQNNGAE
ncbi:MAG: YbaN family protein [Thiolinea sp.]